MPIFKIKNQTVFFNHIPRCGGTSIENYLFQCGAIIAFYDNKIYDITEKNRWNKSSPQHIDGASFGRLFSEKFFDRRFVISRHPVSKYKSAFTYQKFIAKNIPIELSLDNFTKLYLKQETQRFGKYDNHFLPQNFFLTNNWTYDFFKFESGLDFVKKYIDKNIVGEIFSETMPHIHKSSQEIHKDIDMKLSLESKQLILEVYKDDFKIFKYSV